MSYSTCDHLMADGVFCSSPALRNQRFCYYHLDVGARRVQMAQSRRRGESCRLHLPVLDDIHAVQAAVQQVGDALADDRIDMKRAYAQLYMLQQAAANLNHTHQWEGRRPQVETSATFRALEAPDVPEEYDLPANVDLALPPDAAAQPTDTAQQPTPRPSLPRNPSRVVQQASNYFIIPKDPRAPMTQDELDYTLSRMEASIDDEEEAPPSRPPLRSNPTAPVDEEAANVA